MWRQICAMLQSVPPATFFPCIKKCTKKKALQFLRDTRTILQYKEPEGFGSGCTPLPLCNENNSQSHIPPLRQPRVEMPFVPLFRCSCGVLGNLPPPPDPGSVSQPEGRLSRQPADFSRETVLASGQPCSTRGQVAVGWREQHQESCTGSKTSLVALNGAIGIFYWTF